MARYQLLYRRVNEDAAQAFARELQSREKCDVRFGNSRDYRGEVYKDVDAVYHDGLVPEIEKVHNRAGVPAMRFVADREAEPRLPAPEPETDEKADDYRVEQSGTWYKLIGPDGEQVGKSQRSEADAWALREGGV